MREARVKDLWVELLARMAAAVEEVHAQEVAHGTLDADEFGEAVTRALADSLGGIFLGQRGIPYTTQKRQEIAYAAMEGMRDLADRWQERD